MNSNKKSNQQNVDNLEVLIDREITFLPAYDPSETRLSIPNQTQLKSAGDEVLRGVLTAESACSNAISSRNLAFSTLNPLATRVINALQISDVSDQTIEQGKAILRELRNRRASEIAPAAEGAEKEPPAKTNKMRSGSFNTKIENTGKLIVFLSTLPAYKPKEADLTIESLKAKHETLKQTNSACNSADALADAARTQRDIILYADKTGLVDIAMDSKNYTKSAYGAKSAQYKAISDIRFTRRRLN